MKKRVLALAVAACMAMTLAAGCGNSDAGTAADTPAALDAAEIQVFVAASLEDALLEIIDLYNQQQPNVTVRYNADSSGTLLTQMEEGAAADIFFSAATRQMDTLEQDGLVVEGTRVDLLNNQLCLITGRDSGTAVTGLENLGDAASIALADGSVPVGKYTREALIALDILDTGAEAADVTAAEISEALDGVEINQCANVSKVKEAVKEGANEVGTVYYSDAYSVRDDVEILEMVAPELTGEIVYPVCRVVNAEADAAETAAADDFFAFLQSDAALEVYAAHMFLVNEN